MPSIALDRLDPALEHGEERALAALVRRVLARRRGGCRPPPGQSCSRCSAGSAREERDQPDLLWRHHVERDRAGARRSVPAGVGEPVRSGAGVPRTVPVRSPASRRSPARRAVQHAVATTSGSTDDPGTPTPPRWSSAPTRRACASSASSGAATTGRCGRRPRRARGLEGRIRSGIGVTVAMQAMNGLDDLQRVEGMGPVGEIRLVPDPGTFRVLPYAPRTGAMLADQRTLDGGVAPVDQRGFLKRMAGALAERGARLEVAFENEFTLAVRDEERGAFVPIDASLCFSTIGMTAAQDYVDALVDGARGAGDPARAVLRRARPRPAGDLDRPPPRAPGRRRADPRPRDDPRGRRGARPRRVAGAEAVARGGRQRRPHPLLAVGPRARSAIASTIPRRPTASRPRAARSSPACSSTCRDCAASPRRASTPTGASCRSTGPGRSRAGATTTARRRCGCRRCSGAWRRRRPTSSSRRRTPPPTRTSRSAA